MAALRAPMSKPRGACEVRRSGVTSSATFYLRKVTRKDGRLVNSVFKTYPDVSQFWTYGKEAFLANPVYSRDFPPAKYLEK